MLRMDLDDDATLVWQTGGEDSPIITLTEVMNCYAVCVVTVEGEESDVRLYERFTSALLDFAARVARAGGELPRQWPDNITAGRITYGQADNYGGFSLQPEDHGIPTLGAVCSGEERFGLKSEPGVRVFNYPGQTEDIARRLVACWNACVGISTEDLEVITRNR